ncbi:MAG: HYR domain-containing protein, partial [Saprospiraceae bacterium]|nr:HYR domain-containing protein [Saprospiraceae bacterium]
MNNSTTPRQWALAVMSFVFLVVANVAHGQGCTLSGGSIPPVIYGTLNPSTGEYELTRAKLFPAYLQSDPGCIAADANVRFYANQDKTGFISEAPLLLDCNDAIATNPAGVVVWVAVNDDPLNIPASESITVPVVLYLEDVDAPVITAPLNVMVNADAGTCGATALAGVAMNPESRTISYPGVPMPGFYADNCGATLSYTITGALNVSDNSGNDATAETFPVGTSTVTYLVTDAAGFTATASFTVTVADAELPTITCPGSATVNTDPGVCTAYLIYSSTSNDNCSGASVEWYQTGGTAALPTPAGAGSADVEANFELGTTTIEMKVTDAALNTATCDFTITVDDNELPIIVCPSNATRSIDPVTCLYEVTGGEFDIPVGDYGDNCSISVGPANYYNVTNTLDGELFGVGTYTIEQYVLDGDGNYNSCFFDLTVVDTDGPSVTTTFPLTYDVDVTPGDCSAAVTFERPNNFAPALPNYNVFDCGGWSLTQGIPYDLITGVEYPNLFNTVPAFNPTDPLNRFAVVQFPTGTTIVPYIWTDGDGNESIVEISVTVNEVIPPTAACKNATIALGTNGGVKLDPSLVNNGSSDNCGAVLLSVSPDTFTCVNINPFVAMGKNTVTLKVTDKNGLMSTCTAIVTVIDNQPVTMQCPVNIVQDVNQAMCTATVTAPNTIPAMVLEPVYANLGPGEFYDNAGACGAAQYAVTYSVNGGSFLPIAGLAGQVYNLGPNVVSIKVVGPSGIPTSCSFSVNVEDNTPVTIACPTVAPVSVPNGGCTRVVTWAAPTTSDPFGCPGGLTLTSNFASGTPFPAGITTVIYTATDGAGNAQTCSFDVVVRDLQPPVAKCKPFTAQLNAMGQAVVNYTDIDDNSTDNCGYDYVSLTRNGGPALFTCADIVFPQTVPPTTYPVVMTIRDNGPNASGQPNVSSCTAQVTVVDNILPSANCASVPAVITLNNSGVFDLNAQTYGTTYTVGADNCSTLNYAVTVQQSAGGTVLASNVANFQFNCGLIGAGRVVTFRVTDAAGNTATCTKTVEIKDVNAPSITAPATATINCLDFSNFGITGLPASLTGSPTGVSDNCTASPVITSLNVQTVAPTANCPNQTWVRTWVATDASGNSATATQTIQVKDEKKPYFIGPALITRNTDAGQCFATYTAQLTSANVVDTCSAFNQMSFRYRIQYPAGSAPTWNNVLTFTAAPTATVPFGTFPIGDTKITWEATDACGNTQVYTQTVKVNDTNLPVFNYNRCSGPLSMVSLNNTTGACSQIFSWTRPSAANIADC